MQRQVYKTNDKKLTLAYTINYFLEREFALWLKYSLH
jgi:hypothetical protein